LGAPSGVGKEIGLFSVQGLKKYSGKNGETHIPNLVGEQYKSTFKIKSRLDGNGIFMIDSAYQQEEYMVPVVEEKKEAAKTDEKKEGDAKVDEPVVEEAPVEQKMKKTIRKFDLKVVAQTPGLSTSELTMLQQQEMEMESSDKLVVDTAEARNGLEEYVYETRSKLEMAWTEFIADDPRVEFTKTLTAMEDWLYTDEGENGTKSAYVDKLNSLKKTGTPVALRFREFELRPSSEKSFRDYVNHVILSANAEVCFARG
jgi:heat shock protein 4